MAIHRAPRPESHFTQIHNDVIRDDRLSYRARGVLVVLLSHEDGWSTSAEALTLKGLEGRDAIRTALTELEDAGYLVRERLQDGQGRWATQQVIYDRPHLDAQPALFAQVTPTTGNQASGNQPSVDQPSVSQASTEDHQEHLPPTGVADVKPKPPADLIAAAIWDHTQGMVNYMAVRQVAGRALKVKVGRENATPEQIAKAMTALYDAGRPLTLTTVGQQLSKAQSKVREDNAEHWQQGGGF